VWPHDNAICIAGLMRYGFTDHAHRVLDGQLAAARAHDGRLPELFAGFSRDELSVPGAYPAACSPQAWAAAAPLLWLRSVLGLHPWVPRGSVWVVPELPASISRLAVSGISLGSARLDIDITGDKTEVSCSDPGLEIVHERRPPLSSIVTA
jgi:glycogen debranching enzyme